ncbi:MAG: hypothetical protein C5B58_10340, partial [Acidobacteria bacterium]
MATPLNQYFGQAYTEKNLMPGVAGSAAGEQASGWQSQADDYAAIATGTFSDPSSEKPNCFVYY